MWKFCCVVCKSRNREVCSSYETEVSHLSLIVHSGLDLRARYHEEQQARLGSGRVLRHQMEGILKKIEERGPGTQAAAATGPASLRPDVGTKDYPKRGGAESGFP